MYGSDVNRIGFEHWFEAGKAVLNRPGVGTTGLIDHHRANIPILEYFRINAAIREALKPRVDLPSGGYVIIEPTEALTVIDANSPFTTLLKLSSGPTLRLQRKSLVSCVYGIWLV